MMQNTDGQPCPMRCERFRLMFQSGMRESNEGNRPIRVRVRVSTHLNHVTAMFQSLTLIGLR